MVQLYNPPITQLLRSLLLQCVFLLGIVSMAVAQAQLPTSHDGPWANNGGAGMPAGWTFRNLSADGAELEPSNSGGSAVFKQVGSELTIQLGVATNAATRVSFSLRAATTKAEGTYQTTLVVESSANGTDFSEIGSIVNQTKLSSSRQTYLLPEGIQAVRLRMTNRADANLLVDAVKVSTAPEVVSFTPTEGGFDTEVTITGGNFLGATSVAFGNVEAEFIIDSETQITARVPAGAPVGKVVVASAEGTGTSINDFVVSAPVVTTDFSPKEGGAGTLVTIKGQYFMGATNVYFNGVAGTDLDVIDDSKLTVKVPGGASTGRIVVATPAGQDTSFTDFKIFAPEFVASSPFSPARGGMGTAVTIVGKYFSGVTDVSFNGVTASFTEISDTEIQAVVPANAGDGLVKVTTPAGAATSTNLFDFIPAPVIAGFEPVAGVEGTTEVTVRGLYLEDISEVLFADGVAADITDLVLATDQATGEQSFTVTVPEGAVTGNISLKNPGGTATSASVFTVYKAPVIEAFTATTGRPGDVVSITGTGLTGVETVTFLGTAEAEDEVAATLFTVVSDTEIKVTVPIGAISGQIALKNPVAEVTTAALEVSEFTVDATPRIISFSPTTAYQGTELTITGQNLGDVTTVTFFGGASVDVTEAEVTTDEKAIQSFVVVVPAGAQTGPVSVTTLSEATATSDSDLTIISKPFVGSFTPDEGRAGDTFTVTGTGFSGDLTVTIGGGAVTYDFVSDTEITVTLTSDAVTGKVVVSNVAGSGTSTEDFTVLTTPLISVFTPEEGPVGTEVKISGKLLSQVTEVIFGTSAAVSPLSTTATEVVVQVPADATTGLITIMGENGTAVSASEFRVIPSPQIAGFTPETGPVGTEVTITGTNFTDIDSVKFNGIAAASFTVAADGQSITAIVPVDAAKGKITVVNPAGKATSSEDFEVPVPAITSLSKTEGFVGEPVIISGQYFTGASAVTFNGVEAASYDVDSDEQITAYPPADAGEGVIAVTTASGTGDSGAMLFKVLSPEITDIYVREPSNITNEGYFGTEVTIVGNYLEGATDVTFNGVPTTFQSLTDELGSTYILANVPQARLNQNVGPISVTTPSGTGESRESFKTLAPEQITFNPVSGRVGESVTVSGVYFNDVTSISFGGVPVSVPATGQTEPTGTEVKSFKVQIPSGAESGVITVTSTSGTGASAERFTVLSPDILTISPTSGRVGMTTVTISGKYFLQATEVRFMGGNSTSDDVVLSPEDFTIVDDSKITVVVPTGAKTGPISVTTPSGTDASETFTLLVPTLSSFTPAQGQVNRTTFTITGNYFIDASKVTFLSGTSTDVDATSFIVENDNQIKVTVPLGAKTGRIAVTTPSGTGTSSSNFTVLAPVVTSITPAEGSKAGEAITITGKYFEDLQSVQFNGLAATSFTGNLSEAGVDADGVELKSFTIVVPEGAVTGAITLTTLSGTGSSASYRIIPEIDDFLPKVGPFATEVTISGMSLTNSSVTFAGKDGARIAATIVSNSNTEVKVAVPNGARTGFIELTTAGGTVATAEAFVVTSPIIDKLTPTEGKVGSKLTITGVNLRDVGKVEFGGGVATSQILESEDGTSLEVIVPKGAQTGNVKVYALVGPTAVSEEIFTVIVPVITINASLAEFRAMVGEESAPQQYTVNGTNLEASINLTAPRTNFVIASSVDGPYTNSLSIPMNEDSAVINYPVWVKYVPATEDTHQATINHTSVNAAPKPLTVRGSSIAPLPVELMSFNAALQNNNVLLTWATASEQNNSHFEVEMSRNPKNGFEKIGQVDSKGSNSMTRLDYEFTHRLGNLTGTIYYRLKQVDIDGTTDYSKVVAVNVKAREVLQQVLVAPNPINYNSKLYVSAEVSGKANLVVYSMTGKKVYAKVVELQEGPNEVQLPVYEKLNKGMYILSVELNGQVSQVKLVKE